MAGMKLNELAPAPGAHKAPKRIGRGIGSGTGKTAGRGHKGQRSRAGSATRNFEGGQMPIYRRLPKRGFRNRFRKVNLPINLDRLQAAVDAGRIDPGTTIDQALLHKVGLVGKPRDGLRLLARGELTTALTIAVDSASKAAVAAVEKAGGKLIILGADAAAAGAVGGDAGASAGGDAPSGEAPSDESGAAPAAGGASAGPADAGPGA
jgi:large subunit ribosomal protein L15